MGIERFLWTDHAEQRLRQRKLSRADIEHAIRVRHAEAQINEGGADWLLAGRTAEGIPFEAVYDHPAHGSASTVRVVSVWRLD